MGAPVPGSRGGCLPPGRGGSASPGRGGLVRRRAGGGGPDTGGRGVLGARAGGGLKTNPRLFSALERGRKTKAGQDYSPSSRRSAARPSSATRAAGTCHSVGLSSSSDTHPLYPI